MMEESVGFFDLLKLGAKLVNFKITQYRLATSETTILPTHYGQVKGIKRHTIYDELYYAFEGIPYARPPLGELRFRAPQPPTPWEGIRDCTTYANKPLQKHFVLKIKEGSEDCLYLNVYVKKLESEKPLPVIVWIYGGGFQIGEATRDLYSPDYFMKKDVVLVTISYRLGALGFLSLNDPDVDVPGNAGLKDQVMALRWIKSNIANFNGDPNNITLVGESAGAASVHSMMLTNKAKGLFHKAILQSGTIICPWALTPPRNWGYRLALKLGYKGSNNDKEVLRFLSQIDAKHIVGTDNNLFTLEEENDWLFFSFTPVIEPYESEDCIFAKPIKELLKTAWGNEIPLIIGGNSFEGLYLYHRINTPSFLRSELDYAVSMLPAELKELHSAEEWQKMALSLKRVYFDERAYYAQQPTLAYLNMQSFKHFWHPIRRVVLARNAYAPTTPTYIYRFDFDSPYFNQYRAIKCGRGMRGVCHADDLSYLFYNIAAYKLAPSTNEYKTIERMIGMWTAFAANSNPNCASLQPTIWQPVRLSDDSDKLKCLNISNETSYIDLPESKGLEVWDSFYTKETLY